MELNKKRVALTLGALLGLFHAVWAVLVLFGWAQGIYDWILSLHFINLPIVIMPFYFWTAAMLVVFTYIVGYIFGWVFAGIWNWLIRSKNQ